MGDKPTINKTAKRKARATAGARESSQKQIAEALFNPRDRNPYYFNGKPLSNLQELTDYLTAFTGEEGAWVAEWIDYLGDSETANRIRKRPGDFKEIVRARCNELKKSINATQDTSSMKK
ncbi:MAG TPA: hypothetical protein VK436_04615 [Methanocella sp.]|nr:hypothetical protein [Methanocella sp.]